MRTLADEAKTQKAVYESGASRPLGGYAVVVSVYATVFGAGAALTRLLGRPVPDRIRGADLGLLAVATYKAGRLVTKDAVTSFVRAPFTTFEGPAGEGEVNEAVRGRGLRHAVGELLTCPFCFAQWVATAFVFGFIIAPRPTRVLASIFAVASASDWLQFAYDLTKQAERAATE